MSLLHEHEYRARDLGDLRAALLPQRFAAVDPGAQGAVVVCDPSTTPASYPRIWPLAAVGAGTVEELRVLGVGLFVVEAQFLSTNPMTTLRLARRAAVLPSFAAGYLSPHHCSVLWVPPATWQAPLRANLGRQPRRLAGKELSRRLAENLLGSDGRWLGAGRMVQEGIADALALAVWMVRDFWMIK